MDHIIPVEKIFRRDNRESERKIQRLKISLLRSQVYLMMNFIDKVLASKLLFLKLNF